MTLPHAHPRPASAPTHPRRTGRRPTPRAPPLLRKTIGTHRPPPKAAHAPTTGAQTPPGKKTRAPQTAANPPERRLGRPGPVCVGVTVVMRG
eukprot:CAMPEP_0174923636 /NCGR_PEP_ID=MMETSP1355-20121228/6721_1 /TAXON_ID=464990 /ORGANISM="Hemiselmis tepida, Strain CCMP443" /LENGTH=91 /DNA_ID=CAMNT_0016169349 /DNA_START=233 /DNA_END=504 /DNA_ORIENTATION=-